MMYRMRFVAMGLGALLALPGSATGQTIKERVSALERKVGDDGVATALGIDIHALVSATYTYSINDPRSKDIELRVDTLKHHTIDLNQASLFFSRMHEDEDLGFVLNLDFGTTAETTAADWDGDGSLSGAEETNSFEVREAYLTYETPLSVANDDPIRLKAGKFVTLLGWEVIKSFDALNDNISKSILFGFSIPFTHTGLLASIPVSDMVSIDLGVVNGGDNVRDNNDSKSLLAGIGIAPSETVSMYIAGTYGAEQTDNGSSKRATVTANVAVQASDTLTLVLDTTYGNESDFPGLFRRDESSDLRGADWYGAAAYAVVAVDDRLSFALRGEIFDDADGVRTGISNGQTIWEVTPTISCRVTDGLLARVEYRHDESNKKFFGKDDRTQRGSDTFGAELVYTF